jgi:hypothetical protein
MKYSLNEKTGMYVCPHCEKEFSKNGIGTHIWRSHGEGKGHTPTKKGSVPWNKGLTKESDERVSKYSKSISKTMNSDDFELAGFCGVEFQSYMKSEEYSAIQSERMLAVVRDNPESYSSSNVCGRSKGEIYNGEKYDSSWEVVVAKFLEFENIPFERKIEPFTYEFEGKMRSYFPDFYLPEKDLYIEVKGFTRERDLAKWSVVNNLIIITKDEIEILKDFI